MWVDGEFLTFLQEVQFCLGESSIRPIYISWSEFEAEGVSWGGVLVSLLDFRSLVCGTVGKNVVWLREQSLLGND